MGTIYNEEYVTRIWQTKKKSLHNFSQETWRKDNLGYLAAVGRIILKWILNIGCKSVNGIRMARKRDQCQAVVKHGIKPLVAWKSCNLLTHKKRRNSLKLVMIPKKGNVFNACMTTSRLNMILLELPMQRQRQKSFLKKLIVNQMENTFPTFYITRRFTAVTITSQHRSLSWARWTHSTPYDHF
jgi:hypothetical protein